MPLANGLDTAGMDEEASLPKSTIVKCVREALPADVRVASDTLDLLVKCSTEFVQLLATEANEVGVGS